MTLKTARKCRAQRWTADEIKQLFELRDQDPPMPFKAIADALQRDPDQVTQKYYNECIALRMAGAGLAPKQKSKTDWSQEDSDLLCSLRTTSPQTSWEDIAIRLNRPLKRCQNRYYSIQRDRAKDGMKAVSSVSSWSSDEARLAADLWRALITDVFGGGRPTPAARAHALQEIAKATGRSYSQVAYRRAGCGETFGAGEAPRSLSPEMEDARSARLLALYTQHPAARLLGDPPPGRSALDMMRRGERA